MAFILHLFFLYDSIKEEWIKLSEFKNLKQLEIEDIKVVTWQHKSYKINTLVFESYEKKSRFLAAF